MEQFDRGTISADQLFLTVGVDLKIPQTNLWTAMIENVLLPYGIDNTLAGMVTEWIPNPIERMFVALGLNPGIMEPSKDAPDGPIAGLTLSSNCATRSV